VTATCDPWRYNASETVVVLNAATAEQTAMLSNSGRLSVVPKVEIINADVTLRFGADAEERSWALSPGDYLLGEIYLKTGSWPIRYSGAGQIRLTYREAVL
jgi:hypothetical protein